MYLARIRQRDIDEARHPSSAIGATTTLGHAIGLLAATGYHRVFVVDGNGKPIGVVSVTDILRFASSNADASGHAAAAAMAAAAAAAAGASTSHSAASSTSTTPRKSVASPAGSVSPPVAAAGAARTAAHLRTHSQTQTPIVVPEPSPL